MFRQLVISIFRADPCESELEGTLSNDGFRKGSSEYPLKRILNFKGVAVDSVSKDALDLI